MQKRIIIILILTLAVLAGCQSKYALHFYKVDEQSRQELKSEECFYLENYRIRASSRTMDIGLGKGNLLVTNQSGINPNQKNLKIDFFSTEGRINYRLYINLPEVIQKDSVHIDDNSVCWVIGDYERADSSRMYQCREGYLLIDSVKSSKFFAILEAKYFNITGDSLAFSGAIRPKKQKEASRL